MHYWAEWKEFVLHVVQNLTKSSPPLQALPPPQHRSRSQSALRAAASPQLITSQIRIVTLYFFNIMAYMCVRFILWHTCVRFIL